MRISAKSDYAVRAAAELAAADPAVPVKGDRISRSQSIPLKFLENILVDLKRAGIVRTVRGADGGYLLAKPPADVSIADIIRAVDGPLANVRDYRPEELTYDGPAQSLRKVWIAVRGSLRAVLEHVTLANLVADDLPASVAAMIDDPEAWVPH